MGFESCKERKVIHKQVLGDDVFRALVSFI